jgi:hypothetical protein
MMTIGISSRRTTSGRPKASPVHGASGISGNDRGGGRSRDANRMRFWGWRGLSRFAGLLGDIALGRPRAARRNVLCILCVSCHLFRFLLHCSPHLFLFLLLHLYFSPRVDPLHDICICRIEHLKGDSPVCPVSTGRQLPLDDVPATRCLHPAVCFAW